MRKLLILLPLAILAGCAYDQEANDHFTTQERMDKGLVLILPGVEGESSFNHELRQGLAIAGVECAMPIYCWGRPIPIAGTLINQMDVWGNRAAGKDIAGFIVAYQDHHPKRPVYLIGHSGGGGVAVFAAESLPAGRKIDGLILLSASISGGYDLTAALDHCRNGVVNFYSPEDVAVLGIGTSIAGNVDGTRGPAAGLTGFGQPSGSDAEQKRVAYQRVYEVEITGGINPHTAATNSAFVQHSVAPWVAAVWPKGALVMVLEDFPQLLTRR